MSVTLLWILQSRRVEVKLLFVQDILSPIFDCQKGNLLHLWVRLYTVSQWAVKCLRESSLYFVRFIEWKRNIFKDAQNSLWVSYTLYRSRIEVSLFLIFLLFECSIYRTVLKISEKTLGNKYKSVKWSSRSRVSVCTWKRICFLSISKRKKCIVWLSCAT